jgi:hypothetical protein
LGLRRPAAARWWQVRKRWRSRPGTRRPARTAGWDWGKIASFVTAIAALGALVFTGVSLQQSRQQNQLAESGQITDRFNAAVTNLGSGTETIRIGGIYALQRIMEDSARDQPAVMQVLTAFIRQAPTAPRPSAGASPAIDIQSALTVLATRNPDNDQRTPIDLTNAGLSRENLTGAFLADAFLTGANLYHANLTGAFLTGAELIDANLTGAKLTGAKLSHANLDDANFYDANLTGAELSHANLIHANLAYANLGSADLDGANLFGTSLCSGDKPVRSGGYVCTLPPVPPFPSA